MTRVVHRDLSIIRSGGDRRFAMRRSGGEPGLNLYAADPVAWAGATLQFYPDAMQARALAPDLKRGLVNCTRQYGKTTIIAAESGASRGVLAGQPYCRREPEPTAIGRVYP